MRTSKKPQSVRLFVACGLVLSSAGLPACVAGDTGSPGIDGDVGSAVAAITSVPPGVQCIQLVLTGSVSDTINDAVTPGASSASISLGQLPAGAVTVTAQAYNVACSSVNGSTLPSWVGAPTTVTITPGLTTQISLTLVEAVPVNASVNFVPKVQAIAAGLYQSYAVLTDGTVRSWGYNIVGELGDGTSQNRSKPVAVSGLSNVASVTSGSYHACARSTSGAANCWGYNGSGQLGNGTTSGSLTPVSVSGSYTFTQLAAGDSHTCGVTSTGAVLCWGYNGSGQFGNGTTAFSSTPTSTSFNNGPALLGAGYQETLVYYGNSGYAAGTNSFGQFGNGATAGTNQYPVSLGFDGGSQRFIAAIAPGCGPSSASNCALTVLGTVYCSGCNGNGQLGNGTTTSSSTPVQVSGLSNATAVVSFSAGACALAADQSVWCWGGNGAGTLGIGTGVSASTPVHVVGLSGVTALAAGSDHVCALKSDGTVWCWGWNIYGQIGDGTTTNRALPVQVQF